MTSSRALVWWLPLTAATLVLPVTLVALTVALAAVLTVVLTLRWAVQSRTHAPGPNPAEASAPCTSWRPGGALSPHLLWPLALMAWLALTAAWSPATGVEQLTHWLRYAALVLVPVAAWAIPRELAERSTRVFIAAAALVAALQLAGASQWVPVDSALGSVFHYKGNKSIANGALLALAAALALHQMLQPLVSGRERGGMVLAAALIVAAVAWRSASRTSLVLLAALVVLWCLLHWRRPLVWALAGALAAALAVLVVSGGGGLAARDLAGQLQESNRQRAALVQGTWQMVLDKPLAGHGIGSWPQRWSERNRDPALQIMNTAHMEWLQLAQQGGVVAVGLLMLLFAQWARTAWRAGLATHGGPAALTLAAWAALGSANAAVRDASFAVPMMFLLAIALAQARAVTPEDRGRR